MEKKTHKAPSNGTEKMAYQIDEIYNRLNLIENLIGDLMPGLQKIPVEMRETVRELREKFEKDETLKLIKEVGDNIPTFVSLLEVMGAVKGMFEDVYPAIEKVSKEIRPTVSDLRERFEKEETLALMKQLGDNIPTMVSLLNIMEAMKGLVEDLTPATGKIIKEVLPTVNMLRESLEKEEVIDLLKKTGDNIPTFAKLLGFLEEFNRRGDLDYTLENALAKETEYMMKGMEKCAVRTMQQLMEEPLKPGLGRLIAAMWNKEVQKGILLMTTFARNIPQCMSETIEESKSKEEITKK